jgi:hypothetical protein
LATLSHWSNWPKEAVVAIGGIKPEIEAYLSPCSCGGRFRADAAPRCPHCHQILSAVKAAVYIEANAPGAAKGWKWQRSWNGIYALYSVMIEGRVVHDPWQSSKV